ncbi:39S ribosomal protein L10, mitochondrial [Nephila pilipes]|uniref:Large ribosomal subunit protein uL10m n=1 Tax=Nephila pilipes TaxID=299642 RepID=A0A8X6QAR5_NEPPI|nr:39S ribosomal protein L10, mitochondrial [Nephila pilipes]
MIYIRVSSDDFSVTVAVCKMVVDINICLISAIITMILNAINHCFSISKCLRVINLTCIRNFQSRNPRDPHFDRKRMLEICKPIYIPEKVPDWETCPKASKILEEKPHPYEVLLAKELKEIWDNSKMVMFYHVLSLTDKTAREVRNMFFKNDLFFYVYSPNVVKLVVQDTPFTSVQHLFESSTAFLFSPEISIDKVLKISKKTSNVILMAGIIDDIFYSRNQLQNLNEVLKRDGHQELAHLLDYLPSQITGTLDHHTKTLCHYLNEISNTKQDSKE